MKHISLIVLALTLASCGKHYKNGHNGMSGKDGAAGVDGQDAEITSVKFCPNLVDSYGLQYSERGLCINKRIYAVYSTPTQSFLTELSAGQYTTTTPYGNCTFTVMTDSCTVTI